MRRLVEAMVALHRERPALHRVLFEEAPRPPALRRRLEALEGAATAAIAAYLRAREDVDRDPQLAARMVVQVVETVTHELVLRPGDVAVDAYVDEAVILLTRYLQRQVACRAMSPQMSRRLVGALATAAALVVPSTAAHAASSPVGERGCDRLDDAACLLPFPNDAFRQGGKVALRTAQMPRNKDGKAIDAAGWKGLDGFSPGSVILAKVPGIQTDAALKKTGAVSLSALSKYTAKSAPVIVWDATSQQALADLGRGGRQRQGRATGCWRSTRPRTSWRATATWWSCARSSAPTAARSARRGGSPRCASSGGRARGTRASSRTSRRRASRTTPRSS